MIILILGAARTDTLFEVLEGETYKGQWLKSDRRVDGLTTDSGDFYIDFHSLDKQTLTNLSVYYLSPKYITQNYVNFWIRLDAFDSALSLWQATNLNISVYLSRDKHTTQCLSNFTLRLFGPKQGIPAQYSFQLLVSGLGDGICNFTMQSSRAQLREVREQQAFFAVALTVVLLLQVFSLNRLLKKLQGSMLISKISLLTVCLCYIQDTFQVTYHIFVFLTDSQFELFLLPFALLVLYLIDLAKLLGLVWVQTFGPDMANPQTRMRLLLKSMFFLSTALTSHGSLLVRQSAHPAPAGPLYPPADCPQRQAGQQPRVLLLLCVRSARPTPGAPSLLLGLPREYLPPGALLRVLHPAGLPLPGVGALPLLPVLLGADLLRPQAAAAQLLRVRAQTHGGGDGAELFDLHRVGFARPQPASAREQPAGQVHDCHAHSLRPPLPPVLPRGLDQHEAAVSHLQGCHSPHLLTQYMNPIGAKHISNKLLKTLYQDGLPYLQDDQLRLLFPFMPKSCAQNADLHLLHNNYTRNYLLKVLRSPVKSFVFLLKPEVTYMKVKQVYEVLNSILDSRAQQSFKKHNHKPVAQLFNLWRLTQASDQNIRTRLRLQVDILGKARLHQPPPVEGLLQVVPQQFRKVPSLHKKDFLYPVSKYLSVHSSNELKKKGVLVPGINNKIYPHRGVFPPTMQAPYRLFSKFIDANPQLVNRTHSLLDLGCGTGILALVVAVRNKRIKPDLADISAAALQCAELNAASMNVEVGRKIQQDISSSQFIGKLGQSYDLIVSNPPWLPVKKLAQDQIAKGSYDLNGAMLASVLKVSGLKLAQKGVLLLLHSDYCQKLNQKEMGWIQKACRENNLKVKSSMECDWAGKVGGRFDALKGVKLGSKIILREIIRL